MDYYDDDEESEECMAERAMLQAVLFEEGMGEEGSAMSPAMAICLEQMNMADNDDDEREMWGNLLNGMQVNNANAAANDYDLRLYNLCDDYQNAPSVASVQMLINQRVDVNERDPDVFLLGQTALIASADWGHLDAVKTLLSAKDIDIYAQDRNGNTAFYTACFRGRLEVAKELLEAHKLTSNFDINDKNKNGLTVLMRACDSTSVEVIKFLLTISGIKLHLKDSGGRTTLERTKGRANEVEVRSLFQGELFPLEAADKESSLILTHSLSSLSHTIPPLTLFNRTLLTLSSIFHFVALTFLLFPQLLIIRS
jgi:ankyrin repeat protein